MQTQAIEKDIVLIGGGHSHALLLRMWAMQPMPGVRLTLISDTPMAAYSGMLPGVIAGHYGEDELLLDLVKLCRFAGARFIHATVTGIDHQAQSVQLQGRPAIGFDYASINIGAIPDCPISGAAEHATPIKPIAPFLSRWAQLLDELAERQAPAQLAVIGGGAGGVEVLLALEYAISQRQDIEAQFHLLNRGEDILPGYSHRVRRIVRQHLAARGIQLHKHFDVERIEAKQLTARSGETLYADSLFCCTSARAADWPRASGLSTDERGFITVNRYLQSIDNPRIFAVGDIAHMPHAPRPKAGVYAVRQAPVLLHNLRRSLQGKPLKAYQPQDNFLSLLALGGKTAVGWRQPLSFYGAWVWRWKDRIDRRFIAQFQQLPDRSPHMQPVNNSQASATAEPALRCGGCGAKLGARVLSRVLAELQPVRQIGVVQSIGDDAAVFEPRRGEALVQSVDQLRHFIDDPYTFGRLSALHALSDLFAMNATPHSAQAIVNLPYSSEAIAERELYQLMSGAVDELNRHHCALIGGHSAEAQELSLGFVVNGTAQRVLSKAGAQAGDALILTQALGTGVLFAGDMRHLADGRDIARALQAMLHSNQRAAQIFARHQASACTDITGFGLAGHLAELTRASACVATVELAALPVMSGAHDLLARGIRSSLYPSNRQAEHWISETGETGEAGQAAQHRNYPLLFDPQTCGGLLASVPAHAVTASLAELHAAGYRDACVIGHISASLRNSADQGDINTD